MWYILQCQISQSCLKRRAFKGGSIQLSVTVCRLPFSVKIGAKRKKGEHLNSRRRKFSGEVETFEYQKDVSILMTFINLSAFLKGVYGPIRKKWHCPICRSLSSNEGKKSQNI